jgi:hypothetical protein
MSQFYAESNIMSRKIFFSVPGAVDVKPYTEDSPEQWPFGPYREPFHSVFSKRSRH